MFFKSFDLLFRKDTVNHGLQIILEQGLHIQRNEPTINPQYGRTAICEMEV